MECCSLFLRADIAVDMHGIQSQPYTYLLRDLRKQGLTGRGIRTPRLRFQIPPRFLYCRMICTVAVETKLDDCRPVDDPVDNPGVFHLLVCGCFFREIFQWHGQFHVSREPGVHQVDEGEATVLSSACL